MSYWARTVIVPLLVLKAKKPLARNPRCVHCELFVPPSEIRLGPSARTRDRRGRTFFGALDRVLKASSRFSRKCPQARHRRAAAFVTERLNGEDGLGAIYPAMANSVMMYDALGVPPERPGPRHRRAAVEKLLVIKDDEAYCQPCVSPVWDTALAAHALLEAGGEERERRPGGLEWLKPLQVLE